MFQPILNPELPYVGEVQDGLIPGKMVKVQGRVPLESTRFAINYQLGPTLNPRDDIALHVSPRFHDGFITRNHIKSMTWGSEENDGPMLIEQGASFEIIILCEYKCYKIAINGRHFTEFIHRLPCEQVTHLVIDGEVEITSIFYEVIPIDPKPSGPVSNVSDTAFGLQSPGKLYPILHPEGKDGFTSNIDGFRNNVSSKYGYKSEQESEDIMGDCLDKVGLAVGGLVAAGGVAAALHAYNKNKNKHSDHQVTHEQNEIKSNETGLGGLGGLGALGTALASSLASGTFQGDRTTHVQQGYPSQDSNILGSIMGSLGRAGQSTYQQSSNDSLGEALTSILGGVLGSGEHQQPHHASSESYQNYPQNKNSQSSNLLSGLGGAIMKTAMDGLSKRLHSSYQDDNHNTNHSSASSLVDSGTYNSNTSLPQISTDSEGGRLSAAEISTGLGFNKDED